MQLGIQPPLGQVIGISQPLIFLIISVEVILTPLLHCGIFVSMVAGEQEKETRKNRGIKLCFINIRLNETES